MALLNRYIVRAGTVLPMDDANSVIRDGAIIVSGGRIEAVGSANELSQRGPFDGELGGSRFVAFPGLVTAHHHTVGILRRAFRPIPFERREPVNLYAGPWTEEDFYWLNLFVNSQLLKAGTTTALTFFYGFRNFPDLGCQPTVQAFLDSGIRTAFGIAARDRWDVVHARDKTEFLERLPGELAERVEESPFGYLYDTDLVEQLSRKLAAQYQDKYGRFRIFACPDFTPSSTDALYMRMKHLAAELGTGIITHLLETPYEMLHSFRTYGKSAVSRLADLRFLGPDVTCTDCIWLTAEDMEVMADSGSTGVYSPFHISGFNGIAPVSQMLAAGIRLAFSITLRSLNDGYDTLSDLGFAERLQHVPGIGSEPLPAQDLLRMATVNGGRAWALDDSLGSLEAGKHADIVLLDKTHLYDDPFIDPTCDLHRLLAYRGRGTDVHTVIVEGQIVVQEGRCLIINEREAEQRAYSSARRITSDTASIAKWLDLANDLEPYMIGYYRDWRLEEAVEPWGSYNAKRVRAPEPHDH
jgi:5-methylthioadenosine/S-adenosylhomocysteine deaminase